MPNNSRSLRFLVFFFAMDNRLLESLLETGVAAVNGEIPDGDAEGLGGTDKDTDTFCTCDAGVDEVTLEHHVVGHQDWDDHDWELRSLCLVYGCGVGQGDLVQYAGADAIIVGSPVYYGQPNGA